MDSSNSGAGKPKPEGNYQYKARDGLYYNGYLGSFDHIEDDKPNWDKCMEKIANELKKDILEDARNEGWMYVLRVNFPNSNPADVASSWFDGYKKCFKEMEKSKLNDNK